MGHSRLYCTDTCEECEYYKTVIGQKKSILLVTDNDYLKSTMEQITARNGYNVEFADCEYNCSMLMENYRADFIFLDCSMGAKRARHFAQHIAADPRLPFVRIVLVGDRHQFPQECDKEVFATVANPFTSSDLEELISTQNNLLNI
jgi:DNA-binding NtrC family response regulator